jgi:hypothetical protein
MPPRVSININPSKKKKTKQAASQIQKYTGIIIQEENGGHRRRFYWPIYVEGQMAIIKRKKEKEKRRGRNERKGRERGKRSGNTELKDCSHQY